MYSHVFNVTLGLIREGMDTHLIFSSSFISLRMKKKRRLSLRRKISSYLSTSHKRSLFLQKAKGSCFVFICKVSEVPRATHHLTKTRPSNTMNNIVWQYWRTLSIFFCYAEPCLCGGHIKCENVCNNNHYVLLTHASRLLRRTPKAPISPPPSD